MTTRLVGLDCATQSKKIGVACGLLRGADLGVLGVELCTRERSAASAIVDWLKADDVPTLIAVDAPLGWPAPLSSSLAEHRAGDEILTAPNEMFRRSTDRFVQREIGKTPLDVGADRIARTAHAALRILGELRRRLALPIPLAWSTDDVAPVAAIEVYPAATLMVHGLPSSRYKRADDTPRRQAILDRLGTMMALPSDVSVMRYNADALDAVVCLLAARDFLLGEAWAPPDRSVAEREGWIWVKRRVA